MSCGWSQWAKKDILLVEQELKWDEGQNFMDDDMRKIHRMDV